MPSRTQKLKKLTLNANLTNVEESAFQFVNDLEEFIVQEGNSEYVAIDGILYSKNEKIFNLIDNYLLDPHKFDK